MIHSIKTKLMNMKRVTPRSFAFLVILPVAGFVSVAAAYIYFAQSLFRLPECLIHRIFGLPCPTCGLTRSIYAMIHLRFIQSIAFHPLPILALVLVISVWINSLVNVFILKVDKKFPFPFVWYYSILAIVIIFWVVELVTILTKTQ